MSLSEILRPKIAEAVQSQFGVAFDKIEFQATRKDFDGDITVVIFPLLKLVKSSPADIGNKIGEFLLQTAPQVRSYNVVSCFLNLVVADEFYTESFEKMRQDENFGIAPVTSEKAVMVEYSSPN